MGAAWLRLLLNGSLAHHVAAPLTEALLGFAAAFVVGLRSIDHEMLDAAKTLGSGTLQMLWYVEVPLALRTLLGGVRMGLTLAMTGAVVGEFVAADSGLGFLMVLARTNFDPAVLFAAAITMAALSILAYTGVGWVEHRLIDW